MGMFNLAHIKAALHMRYGSLNTTRPVQGNTEKARGRWTQRPPSPPSPSDPPPAPRSQPLGDSLEPLPRYSTARILILNRSFSLFIQCETSIRLWGNSRCHRNNSSDLVCGQARLKQNFSYDVNRKFATTWPQTDVSHCTGLALWLS